MAGGTWTTQNKVRPGAYVNINSTGNVGTSESTNGIMTLPLSLDFGPENTVVEVNATSDLTAFGYDLGNEKMLLLREAFNQATSKIGFYIEGICYVDIGF